MRELATLAFVAESANMCLTSRKYVAQAVSFAGEGQDVGAVDEAINQSSCKPVVPQDSVPLAKLQIARFCRDDAGKPSELATFAHFLQTVINSERRWLFSTLIQSFPGLLKDWPSSNGLLDPNGMYASDDYRW